LRRQDLKGFLSTPLFFRDFLLVAVSRSVIQTDICVSDCDTVNYIAPGLDGEHVEDAEALSYVRPSLLILGVGHA